AAVVGAEQAARDRAAPDAIALVPAAGLERPDLEQSPRHRLAERVELLGLALGPLGVLRRRDLGPRGALVVRAVELDAEVAVVQRDEPAVGWQEHRHRRGAEVQTFDAPVAARVAADFEQTLAGPDEEAV